MTIPNFAKFILLALLTSYASAATPSNRAVGGVYVMTNGLNRNAVIAFARRPNGRLVRLGRTLTGGKGANLDDADGVDPLISANSLTLARRGRSLFLLAVNAGSASLSVLRVMRGFRLRLVDSAKVAGFGPLSVTHEAGLVYVASADDDGMFDDITFTTGRLTPFWLSRRGKLVRIPRGVRRLPFRPATVRLTPSRGALLVTSFSAAMARPQRRIPQELNSYRVLRSGRLSPGRVASVASTRVNNTDMRNLGTPIGLDLVRKGRMLYAAISEARASGFDAMPAPLQTSSVSVWKVLSGGRLMASDLDVLAGSSAQDGQQASCWIKFSPNGRYFWMANTVSGSISAFSFSSGMATLEREVVGRGDSPIDLAISRDGKFLYQMFLGSVGAFAIENMGNGAGLTPLQNVTGIPMMGTQGIVAI